MNNYADRELCQQIYDRKLILDAEMWNVNFDFNLDSVLPKKSLIQDGIQVGLNHCPAYNCVELLDALPKKVEDEDRWYQVNITFNPDTLKWVVAYFDYGDVNIAFDGNDGCWFGNYEIFCEEEICNALSKMILYLNNKGLLKEQIK